MSGSYLNFDVERLLNELIGQYNAMTACIQRFDTVIQKNKDLLDDTIMNTSEEVLQEIKEDMKHINKYISDFTQRKVDVVVEIRNTEMNVGRKVSKV